jgi:hypothetical protein
MLGDTIILSSIPTNPYQELGGDLSGNAYSTSDPNLAYSNNNLTVYNNSVTARGAYGSTLISPNSGIWYWEWRYDTANLGPSGRYIYVYFTNFNSTNGGPYWLGGKRDSSSSGTSATHNGVAYYREDNGTQLENRTALGTVAVGSILSMLFDSTVDASNNNRMSLKIFHNGVKKFTLAPIHYPPNVYATQTSLRVNQTTLRPTKDSWSYDPAVLDLL